MDTQTNKQQPRKLGIVFMYMNVSVFGSFREKLQNNLKQNTKHNIQTG